jgi:hypothetical protein
VFQSPHTAGILQYNPIQSAILRNLIGQIFATELDYIGECPQCQQLTQRKPAIEGSVIERREHERVSSRALSQIMIGREKHAEVMRQPVNVVNPDLI